MESGKAIKTAENIYKGHVKRIEINKNIPTAWNKLILEPDELLVELLGETLEKLCGFRADNSYVENFLKEHQKQFLISQAKFLGKPPTLSISNSASNTSCEPSKKRKSPPTDPWLQKIPELKSVSGLIVLKPRRILSYTSLPMQLFVVTKTLLTVMLFVTTISEYEMG